jgi:hypothetical protein
LRFVKHIPETAAEFGYAERVAVNRNSARPTKRPDIVKAMEMVGMGMGEKDGIDVF